MTVGALASGRLVEAAASVSGRVCVPGDKSISHRAALFNALAEGEATITGFSNGADCASTLGCLRDLGVQVAGPDGEGLVRLRGVGASGLIEPEAVLDCGNSGTSMRLLSGILAGAGVFAVLTGDGSLRRRPMARVVEPLRQAGARIDGREGGRLPPLAIAPSRLRGVEHRLAVASAQVKSALLLAGLFAEGESTVVEPAPTRDHTERMLRAMGARISVDGRRVTITSSQLRAVDVQVPGDFSSAAFWLVLGCVHPAAEIRLENIGVNPTRTGLLDILGQMGADVRVENARDVAGEPVADLVARSSRLRAITVGGELVPLAIDEVPLVALLGLFAEGETVVRDAGELRVKESDRVAVVADGLRALGGDVEATQDGWRIRPSQLRFGQVRSQGDHRMAMLFALAGVLGEGVEIDDAECVAISYPTFWQTLGELTGR
jgi:3-phosphoshikimate 1-carboxyvinyltransferase